MDLLSFIPGARGTVARIDLLGAAVLTAALVAVMSTQFDAVPGERSVDVVAGVCVAVAGLALALHRRAPLVVLGIATVAMSVYGLRDYPGGPVYLSVTLGILAVSVASGPARAWLPAIVSTGTVIAVGAGGNWAIHTLYGSWAAGAVLLGGLIRSRRAQRAALEERARHLAETREEEARRRVAEERVRIARDLHDSVAHSLASISVQAGVGAHVLDERPEEARAALTAIKQASGEALAELRATLGMLRSDDDGNTTPPREPAPSISGLDGLVDRSRAAGLGVDLNVEGEPRPLPSAVETATYRIVQESLTNVLRHAGPAQATVSLRYGPSNLTIEVSDDGRGIPVGVAGGTSAGPGGGGGGGGHGITGMRERAELLGGALLVGPGDAGGFRVRAELPA